jgi:PPOX class probable F420-dependent enzyme
VSTPPAPVPSALLDRAKRIYLTTWSRSGRPGTVPVWFMVNDHRLYFTTLRASLKARRIAAGGPVRVHVGAPDGPSFAATARWVDDRPDLERALIAAYRRKYPLLVPLFMGPLMRRRLRRKVSILIEVTAAATSPDR